MSEANFANKVERAFVQLIEERAESRFKKGEFAAKLWPEMSPKAAASRWTSIRTKASNTGKPQSVSVADAQRMAEVIGKEWRSRRSPAHEKTQRQK